LLFAAFVLEREFGKPMKDDFISYAEQTLPSSKVAEFARQYDGVDMADLMGADPNNFPFVVCPPDGSPTIMIWNRPNGMMAHLEEDPVRHHATVEYLREHAYPEFKSLNEAETYAREHDWTLEPL
jgi:hypothetical protein